MVARLGTISFKNGTQFLHITLLILLTSSFDWSSCNAIDCTYSWSPPNDGFSNVHVCVVKDLAKNAITTYFCSWCGRNDGQPASAWNCFDWDVERQEAGGKLWGGSFDCPHGLGQNKDPMLSWTCVRNNPAVASNRIERRCASHHLLQQCPENKCWVYK
ncbi:hypothetical protein CROQUDRAFT_655690 [Cronartium quercuum f. sp. fusiforme G11]|uniref:Secreted protein n=1 Tax=Cronartium quercuum f. sp. fusiforme G11 TaxID=708437 RepID=A0A9P6NQH2_9BASI|nr:hypothetical protein CROQUDRAFT_655690 [Cronartium quercuum f. sp. fusiforme G11]